MASTDPSQSHHGMAPVTATAGTAARADTARS